MESQILRGKKEEPYKWWISGRWCKRPPFSFQSLWKQLSCVNRNVILSQGVVTYGAVTQIATMTILQYLSTVSPHQLSSVAVSCPNLCDPMDCSVPVPVHYQLLEPNQTHRTGNILDNSIPHPLIAFSFPRHSVQFSHSVMSESLPPHGLQHARPLCPSPTPRDYSNSCPLRRWCHPAISSSVIPFSSCLQSFPASGSLPMSQFFASGGQSIGVSASTLVLPMNNQDWSPLG